MASNYNKQESEDIVNKVSHSQQQELIMQDLI